MSSQRRRQRYMTPYKAWKPEYDSRAAGEGWGMFDCSDGFFQLQADDNHTTFHGDAEAVAFVVRKALAGSKLHLLALYLDGRHTNAFVDLHKALLPTTKRKEH